MDEKLNQIFEKHSLEVRRLTLELRKMIQEIHPDFEQDTSVPLSNLYFKKPKVVCALSLHSQHVNLHFYRGIELPDPRGVLLGSGKKLRHLKFVPSERPDPELLQEFVLAAVALEEAGPRQST